MLKFALQRSKEESAREKMAVSSAMRLGHFLQRTGTRHWWFNETDLASLDGTMTLKQAIALFPAMGEGEEDIVLRAFQPTRDSAKRLKRGSEVIDLSLEEEEEDEATGVKNPPLFYQNSIPVLETRQSEAFCTRNVWELMESPHLVQECFILSYMVDLSLVAEVFPARLREIPVTLVHGCDAYTEDEFRQVFTNELSRLLVPKLPSAFGKYHTKMILLLYEKGLRVIVHTANLEVSNLFYHAEASWFQDFPLKQQQQQHVGSGSDAESSEFANELVRILRSSNIPEAASVVKRYDFSTAEVALVATIPRAMAYTTKAEISANGLGRVCHLLEQERERDATWGEKIRAWDVVVQTSSLGKLASNIGPSWFESEFAPAFGAAPTTTGPAQQLKVVVISQQNVEENVIGPVAANATFYEAQHMTDGFLRQVLCTWTPSNALLPTRRHLLPHIKTYTCCHGQEIAWAMIGSHNATKAAWGYYTARGKFTCLAHEVSVCFLPSYMKRAGPRRWNAVLGVWYKISPQRHIFSSSKPSQGFGFLPIPFALPVAKYKFGVDTPFVQGG